MNINDEGKLKVVHDDKLHGLLENLKLSEGIKRGEVKCKFCKIPISFENLGAIFPESNTIKIVCGEPACMLELTNYINEKNV